MESVSSFTRGSAAAMALNGAVYVASARHLARRGFVVAGTRFVKMPRARSVDVDEFCDLELARLRMSVRANSAAPSPSAGGPGRSSAGCRPS